MKFRYAVTTFLAASTTVVVAFQPSILTPRTTLLHVDGYYGRISPVVFSTKDQQEQTNAPAVTVERLENSAVLVHIPVPGKATQAAYDKICRDLSKKIQVPGFRKGSRLPTQVLEQSMSAQEGGRNALKIQAIKELVGQLVEPTMKEQALDPIGQLTLKVSAEELAETFVPGEALILDVQCDVWPEIKWKQQGDEKPYVDLKASYKRKPYNQVKLDKAVMDLRERYATLTPIDDKNHALEMGDACTVNMVGYMADSNGKKGDPLPKAASGDRVQVILGKALYMEGLVEGLVGAKAGDSVTVSVSFPTKLRDKTLAGKRAIFDVEILDASKRIIPEITDEFAPKVRPGLTRESLMEELRKAVDQEDSKEFTPARNQALGKALAQVLEVVVPDTLVTNQAREKFANMMAEMRDGGVSDDEIKKQIKPENFLKYKNIVKDDIISDFKVSMATDEIARLEGITVPAYQVDEQMEVIRKDAAESKEEFDEAMIRGKVETTLTRQAVYEWLAERAELTVQYLGEETFDEKLMEKLAQESLQREQQGMPVVAAGETTVIDATVESVVAKEPAKKVETSHPVPVAESIVDAKVELSLPKEPAMTEELKPEPVAVKAPVKAESKPAPAASEVKQEEKTAPTVTKTEEPKTEPVAVKAPVKAETKPAPVAPVVKQEEKPAPIDEAKMTVQERAFSALLKAGSISLNKSPDDPDYDHSKDSEVADGTIFKQ